MKSVIRWIGCKWKYVHETLGEGTVLRFNPTLERFSKVSVRDALYHLRKNNGEQIIDTTIIGTPNSGGYLLEQWNIKCIDKNILK